MTNCTSGTLFLLVVAVSSSLFFTEIQATPGLAQVIVQAQSRAAIDRDEAAAIARAATGGRVLSVVLRQAGKRPRYQVKILLAGGRIRSVSVDARTGELLD